MFSFRLRRLESETMARTGGDRKSIVAILSDTADPAIRI